MLNFETLVFSMNARSKMPATSSSQDSQLRPNRSLERNSTGWPHYAQQLIIASCGQPVSSPQLQR